MGNVTSSCPCRRNRVSSLREITLLMIGLDNAGKTCTTKHLLGESTHDVVPTVGFTSVQLKHGKYNVCIYDIGGGPKIRGIWKRYYALVHGLIFLVDASDTQRFEECRNEINNVLKDERIAGKPMLLLLNKQDVDGAVNESELVSQLDLEVLVNEHRCPTRVECSCAIYDEKASKDPGIQEGFNWLIGHIGKEFGVLSQKVQIQKDQQMKEEQKEREERMERVRKLREEREKAQKESRTSSEDAKEEHDDDDDVIEGNPFRPLNVIKAELEQKAHSTCESSPLPSGAKVIHVSPTHSADDAEEQAVQPRFAYSQVPSQSMELKGIEPSIHHFTRCSHPSEELHQHHAFKSISNEDIRELRRLKKPKKRFKNRVVPEISEIPTVMSISGSLPPLKPIREAVPNGHLVYSPSKGAALNGKVNWSLAEELQPSVTLPLNDDQAQNEEHRVNYF